MKSKIKMRDESEIQIKIPNRNAAVDAVVAIVIAIVIAIASLPAQRHAMPLTLTLKEEADAVPYPKGKMQTRRMLGRLLRRCRLPPEKEVHALAKEVQALEAEPSAVVQPRRNRKRTRQQAWGQKTR
ncbi:hypothetical protein CYMTET_56899 [Cymbomonas tetramitiformis]|uniref:Uncharacterized protein n=1 Tax=Cymbomonas tetramitiformis TaxID=36881 RepID=A0AAE0BAF9_9CHLO|nr:hypothetical protein CYMTET_56899 [Cymbomonas tetramitiformis]